VLVYLGVAGREGLRHGAFAQGSLGTRAQQAITLPLASVRSDKPQPYVQLIEGDSVRHAPVETGARIQAGNQTRVVVTGLSEGAQVLGPGVGAMREGVKVRTATASAR